ncbi:MAG: hypothetical protein KBT02_00575 [Treponema sp.]|nr:hypothetical protein [Candidatus Treponema caballi]
MLAIVLAVILLAFAVVAWLPGGFGWSAEIIAFLKGFCPFLAFFLAIVCIFVGIADIKDKQEARKEEEETEKEQNT